MNSEKLLGFTWSAILYDVKADQNNNTHSKDPISGDETLQSLAAWLLFLKEHYQGTNQVKKIDVPSPDLLTKQAGLVNLSSFQSLALILNLIYSSGFIFLSSVTLAVQAYAFFKMLKLDCWQRWGLKSKPYFHKSAFWDLRENRIGIQDTLDIRKLKHEQQAKSDAKSTLVWSFSRTFTFTGMNQG